MNLRPLMCWAVAGTVVSVATIAAFGQSSTPSRPSRPLRPVDQTVQPAPSDAGGVPSRPGRPMQPAPTDQGNAESENPYINPRAFLKPGSIWQQNQVNISAIARKSGDWADPAVWGIGEQGARPGYWPIELPWPTDPRTQEVDVYTGNWTVTVQGDARARSCSGTIAGSGVLSLSGSFSGTVLGATIRTRELSGNVSMIDGVLDAMGDTLVLDYRRTKHGKGLAADSWLPEMRFGGCGVVRGSIEVANSGLLAVNTCPQTLPRAEAYGLSITGNLKLLQGGRMTIDVPGIGPDETPSIVHRLTVVGQLMPTSKQPPLKIDGSFSSRGVSSRVEGEIDVAPVVGASISMLRSGMPWTDISPPFTTVRVTTQALSQQIVNTDNRVQHLLHVAGRWGTNESDRERALAIAIPELTQAAKVSTDALDAVIGKQASGWWATSFTPETDPGLGTQSCNLEAIGVRLPEYAHGGEITLDSLSECDHLVLVTHGTKSSGNRSVRGFFDDNLITMGQIAMRFAELADKVNPAPAELWQPPVGQFTQRSPQQIIEDNFRVAFTPHHTVVDSRWHVAVLDWREWATGNEGPNPKGAGGSVFNPWLSAFYGQQIGRSLADEIVARRAMSGKGPMKRLHLLGHSSGSWLVDAIADRLREHWGPREQGGPDITLTLFDAFEQGSLRSLIGAKGDLGESADMCEHYYENTMPMTQAKGVGLPRNASNFDVSAYRSLTQEERDVRKENEYGGLVGRMTVGIHDISMWPDKHGWPYGWYLRTMESFITNEPPRKPCEVDPDCRWREWGVIRSPLAQDYLAMQRSSGQEEK